MMQRAMETNQLAQEEFPESSAWHKTALQETETRFEEGKERLLDWQSAKKGLQKHFE